MGALGGIVRSGIRAYKKWILLALALAAAATGSFFAIRHYIDVHTMKVYQVYVGTQPLGDVKDPKKIDAALDRSLAKAKASDAKVVWSLEKKNVSYKEETLYKPNAEDDAVTAKVLELVKPYPTAVRIKVDGKIVATVKDEEAAQAILEKLKKPYEQAAAAADGKKDGKVSILSADSDDKTVSKTTEVESVDFEQQVDVDPVAHIDPSQVQSPDQVVHDLQTGGVKPTKYKIQPGDCISCIAEKFDIPQQTIYDNNPWLHADDVLQIGKELDLTVRQPTLTVVTQEKVTETVDMAYATEYQNDDTLPAGRTRLVREGKDGQKVDTYLITKKNGIQSDEELLSEQILLKPVSRIVKRGTKIIPSLGTGSFSWPVRSPRVTSGYGTRWGAFHKGVDIISRTGDLNIRSADNGTVIYAQYNNGGYGNCVLVDHHDGYVTRYAHLRKISVKVGQVVEKGDPIGIMGETGDADGIHLHFEIMKSGSVRNPMGYLNQ